MKFLYIILLCSVVVSCTQTKNIQEYPRYDSMWLTSEGKGSNQRLAIGKAWRNAMKQILLDTTQSSPSVIEKFVVSNWRRYTVGDPQNARILKRYIKRKIIVEVHVESQLLQRDFRNVVNK